MRRALVILVILGGLPGCVTVRSGDCSVAPPVCSGSSLRQVCETVDGCRRCTCEPKLR